MNNKQLKEYMVGTAKCQTCGIKKRYLLVVDMAYFPYNFPKSDLQYIQEQAKCCQKPFYLWESKK